MDPAAYVSALQGRPWAPDAHCWDLVRDAQAALFGRSLPPVLIDGHLSAPELVRAFRAHPAERARWRQVTHPAHGAVVLMHRPGTHARAIHAGLYLDLDGGGVLHVDDPHGVTFDDPLALGLRNWACDYFLPVEGPCSS